MFQATITGAGNISVYQNDTLIGSLEQNTLVEEYHDVLWAGPVHELLVGYLRGYLVETEARRPEAIEPETLEAELLMRWINAICRILMNIQRYRHGGGLLITPQAKLDGLNVKYKIRYDRLLNSLRGMVESQLLASLASHGRPSTEETTEAILPYALEEANVFGRELVERMKEVLGAVRFISSLSCVDGFVLLDRRMVVHGFGVEVRTDNLLVGHQHRPRFARQSQAHASGRADAIRHAASGHDALLLRQAGGLGIRRLAGRRHSGHDPDCRPARFVGKH